MYSLDTLEGFAVILINEVHFPATVQNQQLYIQFFYSSKIRIGYIRESDYSSSFHLKMAQSSCLFWIALLLCSFQIAVQESFGTDLLPRYYRENLGTVQYASNSVDTRPHRRMLQDGTDNDIRRPHKIILTLSNFQSLSISVNRSSPIILVWPNKDHEVLVTTNNTSVIRTTNDVSYTKPGFNYTVDDTLLETRFEVPDDFEGSLYYFCKAHASMEIHEIRIFSRQQPLIIVPLPQPDVIENSNLTSSSSSPDPFMIAGITLGVLVICAVIIFCLIRKCARNLCHRMQKTDGAKFCPVCDRMEVQHE